MKSLPGKGILFPAKNDVRMVAYSDSDWGSCVDTRWSVIGFYVLIGSALVSWRFKKQTVVVRSTIEVEYRAMSAGTCEVIWLLNLLKDFQVNALEHVELKSDNKFAIRLSRNPVFHDRTKHVEMDMHFI